MPQSRKRRTGKSKRTFHGAPGPRSAAPATGSDSKTGLIALIALAAVVIIGVVYFVAIRKSGGGGTEVTTASGLKYTDLVEGSGATAQRGKTVTVHYTGTLENGFKFDSSRDPGKQPYTFQLGTGQVIKGWEEGLSGMKVGGKRKLVVPANLGYGATGRPPQIPGNSTLLFDVELVDVR